MWGRPSHPFAQSNMGQFFLELSLGTNKTLRELGSLRREDPELYEFYIEAFAERNKRGREP